jgi:hypothetical protein
MGRTLTPGPVSIQNSHCKFLDSFLSSSLHNQVLDDAVRAVDVLQGATTQSVSKPVVFFFREVTMRLVEKFERPVIAARVSKMRIDWRMIVQILPVINRGMLDLGNGLVNFSNGMFFFTVHMAGFSLMLEVGARMAQVGEGMQISRMSSRFIGEGHRGAERDEECEYGAMS